MPSTKALLHLSLTLAAVLAAPPLAAAKGGKETVAWQLTSARLVEPGTTVTLAPDRESGFPGGTLTTGAVLEAKARASRGSLVAGGTFRLVLSAFLPNADMPGQPAGSWAVEGKWTLVDSKARAQDLGARHNPFLVEGRLKAALPRNPALEAGAWSAAATLPAALAAGRWAIARSGSLSLDGSGGGALSLDVSFFASK